MREPKVVRRARVQRTSLCAIGIPVSAWPSPRARRASASLARSSACLSSMLMKAFSSRPWRSMRSRHARVSSTDEIFLAVSAAPSSASVPLSKLLNDFGHKVEPVVDRGRYRLISLALVGFAHFVGPQSLHDIERMGHRLDALRVDF